MGPTSRRGEEYTRGDNFAETYVSWEDAQAFCKKLSEKEKRMYRLPTEAEWEIRLSWRGHDAVSALGMMTHNWESSQYGTEGMPWTPVEGTHTKWGTRIRIHSGCMICTETSGSGARTCTLRNYREGLIRWFPPGSQLGCSGAAVGEMARLSAGLGSASGTSPTTRSPPWVFVPPSILAHSVTERCDVHNTTSQ